MVSAMPTQELPMVERRSTAIQARQYSRRTEQAYVHWVPRFLSAVNSPEIP